jgi:hypothetical protein
MRARLQRLWFRDIATLAVSAEMPSGCSFADSGGGLHPGTRKTQDGYHSNGENKKHEEDAFLRLSHGLTSSAARLSGSVHLHTQFANGGRDVRV